MPFFCCSTSKKKRPSSTQFNPSIIARKPNLPNDSLLSSSTKPSSLLSHLPPSSSSSSSSSFELLLTYKKFLEETMTLKGRVKAEKSIIEKILESNSKSAHILERDWAVKYANYLKNEGERVEEVDNRMLIDLQFNREKLESKKDFILISENMWRFVKMIYGGGPEIYVNEKGNVVVEKEDETGVKRGEEGEGEEESALKVPYFKKKERNLLKQTTNKSEYTKSVMFNKIPQKMNISMEFECEIETQNSFRKGESQKSMKREEEKREKEQDKGVRSRSELHSRQKIDYLGDNLIQRNNQLIQILKEKESKEEKGILLNKCNGKEETGSRKLIQIPKIEVKKRDSLELKEANEINSKQIEEYEAKMRVEFTKVKPFSLPVVGINNSSLFCFLNSGLQCLLSVELLVEYYGNKKWREIQGKRMKDPLFSNCFSNLIQEIKSKEPGDCINASSFKKSFKKVFDPSQMHDCSEFIRFLLSNLQDESNPPPKKREALPKSNILPEKQLKNSKENGSNEEKPKLKEAEALESEVEQKQNLDNPHHQKQAALSFWLSYRSEHPSTIDSLFGGLLESRVSCGNCGHKTITYDPFMDLALPICDGDLRDCFKLFFKREKVEGYKCEKCSRRGDCERRMKVGVWPKVLVVMLKRFKGEGRRKIDERVDYKKDGMQLGEFSIDQTPVQYDLTSLAIHAGSLGYGHYVAFGKRNEEWYYFDDEEVRRVRNSDVMRKEAYLLFYERKD